MKNTDSTRLLFDLPIFSNRKTDLLSIVDKWFADSYKLRVIYTPNPEQIIQSRGNEEFKQALQKADLLLPDGIGLVWAAQILSWFGKATTLSERIAGVDVVSDLLKIAHQQKLKALVIGGRDYSADDSFIYQGDKIYWSAAYDHANNPTVKEEQRLTQKIKTIQPDLVFVALGAPQQELWIEQHRELLTISKVRLAMAVGGSFDYLLGKVSRAPQWAREIGLEWLFRLLAQPWRIVRQLRLIKFGWLVMKELSI